jgi:integrase
MKTGRLDPAQLETTTPGRYSDGAGLSLVVKPSGAASWSYQYRVGGRVKEMGLGAAAGAGRDGLTLEQAKAAAQRHRDDRKAGTDPLQAKRDAAAAAAALNTRTSFGEFARGHIEASIAPAFRGAKTGKDWQRSIALHCKPLLPKRPADITMNDVEACLRPIWQTKTKTATELRGRIERLLDAAKVKGLRTGDNPARWEGGLREILPKPKRPENHHAAADYKDVPAIVAELLTDISEFDLSRKALVFTILTAVRTTETRGMLKREVDVKSATWTIPAARMKMEKEHRVPLSPQALAIFTTQAADIEADDLVFPGLKPGQMLGENAMTQALQDLRPGLTVHGFRSSFRDWISEATDFGFELGEIALAHKVGTKVSRAYARSDQLEKRRPMMDQWANYINQRSA